MKKTLLTLGAFALAGVSSQAAIDTNVTGIVTDTTTFIGTLFPVKATIVVAAIAFSLVKFLKGR
jgi:hypothetical protein